MEQQVEEFPSRLEQQKEEACLQLKNDLQKEFTFEKELHEKQIEGEKIETLTAKIKDLEAQNLRLIKRTDEASHQVQDIAVKAVEGAARETGSEKQGKEAQ